MKKYIEKFLKEKGIIVASDLSALDKIDPFTAKNIKKDIVGLDFINASHVRITNYLDGVMAYAESI